MRSIIDPTEKCLICGETSYVEEHHIFYGVRHRKISDKNGFTCWLCLEHHRGTYGVHGKNGEKLNLELKQLCQRTYEKTHTRKEFMDLIHKNYLEE